MLKLNIKEWKKMFARISLHLALKVHTRDNYCKRLFKGELRLVVFAQGEVHDERTMQSMHKQCMKNAINSRKRALKA